MHSFLPFVLASRSEFLPQRIIVGHAAWYALDDQDKQLVFPPAYHIWKDEMDSLDKLVPFLQQKMCTTHRNELEAASAFLTPTAKSEQIDFFCFDSSLPLLNSLLIIRIVTPGITMGISHCFLKPLKALMSLYGDCTDIYVIKPVLLIIRI